MNFIKSVKLKNTWQLYAMILPGMILVLLFLYYPLLGILIAFEDYMPAKGIFGSPWVGLSYFEYMFKMPDTFRVLWNTFYIAILKILFNFPLPIIVAILLNEVKNQFMKRSVQTLIYLPYFISWVILSGIIMDLFSRSGVVNQFLDIFHVPKIFFLGDNRYFVGLLVGTDVWKNFGYGTVIYLASITGIDESLYESAVIDGASRWKQTLHITLPGMAPIIILMLILSIGNVLNAGFDQIFNLYNPLVYKTSDIIDTYVYRIALVDNNFSLGTAVGLLKSIVSFFMITLSYIIANKCSDYSIF